MAPHKIFIVHNLTGFFYSLFLLIRPTKVYYLNSTVNFKRIKRKKHFQKLNTDLYIEGFEDSLVKSFECVNSNQFKETGDYKICHHLLKSLLGNQPDSEVEIALKRLFHRNLYNDYKKNALIDFVLRTHGDCKISIIDFTGGYCPYNQIFSAYNRPLKYLEATFVFLRRLFLKTISVAYFLKIIKPFKIRLEAVKKKIDILLNITCSRQRLFLELYTELVKSTASAGFFTMEKDLCDEYRKNSDYTLTCFHKTDMTCSYKLLYKILITFFKFYAKAIRLKDISVFRNVFVFMEKYFTHVCIFENIQCRKIVTSEDYSEFNPRHFAAKKAGCEIVNILTSKIVPLFNPYLSFCLIDREISFTSENFGVHQKSGCQVCHFTLLNNFDGFLGFMQERYDDDIKEITKLIKKVSAGTNRPKIITYYSSGGEHNFAYIDIPVKTKTVVLNSLRKYLLTNNDTALIIKPHPGETDKMLFDKEYDEFFDLPNAIILNIDKEISAYSFLECSDLNIADISTMGTHSKYFGFNTVVANMLNIGVLFEQAEREDNSDYRYVSTEEELFSAIKELATREKHYSKGKNDRADAFIGEIGDLVIKNAIEDEKASRHNFTVAKVQ